MFTVYSSMEYLDSRRLFWLILHVSLGIYCATISQESHVRGNVNDKYEPRDSKGGFLVGEPGARTAQGQVLRDTRNRDLTRKRRSA
jgi:hypothetical protein